MNEPKPRKSGRPTALVGGRNITITLDEPSFIALEVLKAAHPELGGQSELFRWLLQQKANEIPTRIRKPTETK